MSEAAPIALLHALDAEGAPFLEALGPVAPSACSGRSFYLGSIGANAVVVARTGVGKVASAHSAALAITKYGARAVIVVGAAGALASEVRVGDLVLATSLVQHDLGVREGRRSAPSADLRLRLRAHLEASGRAPREGTVLTGDKACVTLRRRLFLRWRFRGDRPVLVDMESAAAGAVAEAAGVPHLVLRVATDRAGPLALAELQRNFPRLAGEPARCIVGWLRQGPLWNR
jgi:adenosylhomocysteine/aminodeoxyfutalosine nucleosidase